ncbi:MAG: hypothetical protein ACKVOB_09295, partial [Sphingomonas sp.]
TIPICKRLWAVVAATVLATTPAFADTSQQALAAYVRARAADADGNPRQAAQGYAQALADTDPVVAVRAYRAAIDAGDYALATRARLVLERAGVAPSDAALLALADAIIDADDAGVQAAIRRIGSGPLAFLARPLLAWRLAARDDPGAIEALAGAKSDALDRGFAAENRLLLMIVQGQQDAAIAQLKLLTTSASPVEEVQRDAAELLALTGRAVLINSAFSTSAPAAPALAPVALTPLAGKRLFAIAAARLLSRLAITVDGFDGAKRDPAIARAALRIDPGDDRARVALAGALMADRGASAALAILDEIGAGSQYFRDAQARRADVLEQMGKHDEALAIAASLATGAAATSADLRRYAAALRSADRYADAAHVYVMLLAQEHDAADWALHVLLGESQERGGDWRSGRAHYEKAVALAPDRAVALNYLGYALVEHGEDLPRAQKLLEKAAALAPKDYSILDSLAWAYFKQSDIARALPLLERAARASPENGVIAEHLGDAYWKAGRRYEARYAWRSASVEAAPKDAERLGAKIADGPARR